MKLFKMKRGLAVLMAVVLSITLGGFGLQLQAQSFFGSIVGSVTDTTGAIVPGAKVTVMNLGTNGKREAVTDASGNYRVVNLVPADYRVEVDGAGFKRLTREPISVRVGSEARIDVAMEIGSATETVEVTSQAPLLQTESGMVSDAVEGQRVQEMPLNGRNTMNLIALTPGVVAGAPSGASALNMGTHTSNATWSDYSVGGGFTGASAMYLDGATLNLFGGNPIAFIPTQDAVQEFQIASGSVSPEFGRYGGGVVNMTSKSGSNQWHGSAYEYFRNNTLNANNFFNNKYGEQRPKWNQNQYGVTFSNPVLKDKLFSFFSWEGFRLLIGVPGNVNVPSDDLRNGIFSSAIHDPFGTDGGNGQLARSGCISQPTATTWQIKASCIDPTAKAMLDYWPKANAPTNPLTNFVATPVTGNNADQYTERIDWNVNPNQRVFGRFSHWGQVDLPYNNLGNFTKNAFSHNRSTQYVLGDTYTVNPTTIVDVRLAALRQFTDNQPYTKGQDLGFLGGQWGTLQNQLMPKYYPAPHVFGKYNLYPLIGMGVSSQATLNAYDLGFSVTKITGNHSIKAGGEIRLSDSNAQGFTLNGGGWFVFVDLPWLAGDNFANFLLGAPAQAQIDKVAPVASYNWYQGYFVSDTWQVNKKLTLNYGIRWELPGAMAERKDRATVLVANAAAHTATLALTNSTAYSSRYVQKIEKGLIAPRVGMAYRLTTSDVIRAGFGISYLPPDLASNNLANGSPINTASTAWSSSPFGSTATTDHSHLTLSNPFPTKWFPNGLNSPVGRAMTTAWVNGLQKLVSPVADQAFPWIEQWSLNYGHQFKGDLMAEVSYLGSSGKNLPVGNTNNGNLGLNQLEAKYWNATDAIQANRPFPAFNDVQDAIANYGVSNYQAGILKLEKRFKAGGVLSGNYTYSKSLADVESGVGAGNLVSATPNTGNALTYAPQDQAHLREKEYSLSSFDVRQRVMISYVLELPFGEGKRFANFHGLAGKLVSGWSLNGITNFQKGFPLQMTQSSNTLVGSVAGFGALRPNVKAGCDASGSGAAKDRLNSWFKTSCYTAAGAYELGNTPRVEPKVRTPGTHNWDISVLKSTKIFKSVNAQFRGEFFNMYNHPQFAAPHTGIDDPTSFGTITAQANNPRLVQLSMRINF